MLSCDSIFDTYKEPSPTSTWQAHLQVFFKKLINYIIYLCLCWVFIAALRLSLVTFHGLLTVGASLVAEHGLLNMGSVVVAHGLNGLEAHGI